MEEAGKRQKVQVSTDRDKTVINKIMQRFRLIAPKPVLVESSDETKSCRFLGKSTRSKRKYVKVRNKNISTDGTNNNDRIITYKNGCDGEKIKTDLDKEIDGDDRSNIVTLQLLPENSPVATEDQAGKFGLDLSDMDPKTSLYGSTVSSLDRKVVESWLKVECVSDTYTNLGRHHKLELNRMDHGEERLMRMLEVDTCPWLVSDMSNRVFWANRAYWRMIGDPDGEVHIRVWLVVAMDLMDEIACMVDLYGSVTCRVRVWYEPSTWRKEKSRSESKVKMTVPCDVWRIRSGEFAWRLDLESALTLGR